MERVDILTVMSLLTHVHIISPHLFLLSKIGGGFHYTGLLHILVDLYLIISVLVLLQMVFLEKFRILVAYLPVYRCTVDFCTFNLAASFNSLISCRKFLIPWDALPVISE